MPKQEIKKSGSAKYYVLYTLQLISRVPRLPDPPNKPPQNRAFIYEIVPHAGADPLYVGQTSRSLRGRVSSHVYHARKRTRKNPRLEAVIRRIIRSGQPLVLEVVAVVKAGPAADRAERARIAHWRAKLGTRLLNIGAGGEKAPVGRQMSQEQRERAAAARQARLRSEEYRRLQSTITSLRRHTPEAYDQLLEAFIERGLVDTREQICRDHGLPPNSISVLTAGRANGFVVNADLLRRAREMAAMLRQRTDGLRGHMREAAIAYAGSPEGVTIAETAVAHGIDPERLADAIQRRNCGIDEELARRIQSRVAAERRRRGSALGQRSRRIDRRRLIWLLTAYSRGAAGLTITGIASRLGVTQSRISYIIAGRTKQPLPRKLVMRCRERARHLQGMRGRGMRVLSDEQVIDARRRRHNGESLKSVAARLGVSKSLLSRALRGDSYRHVTGS